MAAIEQKEECLAIETIAFFAKDIFRITNEAISCTMSGVRTADTQCQNESKLVELVEVVSEGSKVFVVLQCGKWVVRFCFTCREDADAQSVAGRIKLVLQRQLSSQVR